MKNDLSKPILLSKKGRVNRVKSLSKIWDKWLLRLWGMVIHNRDRGCQWCGKQDGKLDAHHIFGRVGKSTRWDTDNGILLCFYCHHYRKEKDPEGLRACVIMKLGHKKYKKLYQRAKTPALNIDYGAWECKLIKELNFLNVSIPKKPRSLEFS